MELNWDPTIIDLNNLIGLSEGDEARIERYLRQFQQLIPERMGKLRESLAKGERKMIRQILHHMSPQLQFFGIPQVVVPIRRLEHEYETMPFEELEALVGALLLRLDVAGAEVEQVLRNHF